ncbi:MAG: hypothetical protein HUJ30_08230 [Gammaproteobacteria bacterium]|nr:hypothetical protein [Gammaproteobacteria bacterium]
MSSYGEQQPTDEAEILFPDQQIVIDGKSVTVKEFTFEQGLELGRVVRPLVVDMESLFEDSEDPNLDDIGAVFAKHIDQFFHMLHCSTSEQIDWLKSLNDSAGNLLMIHFWAVNKDFFIRRLVQRKMERAKIRSQH